MTHPTGGGGRRLPILDPRPEESSVSGGTARGPVNTRPDPARIAAGWEYRFVAAGARAEEMIALYRELGYQVAADPVIGHDLEDGCQVCFASGGEQYWSIYTRRQEGD